MQGVVWNGRGAVNSLAKGSNPFTSTQYLERVRLIPARLFLRSFLLR